jgi:hypothetical protein
MKNKTQKSFVISLIVIENFGASMKHMKLNTKINLNITIFKILFVRLIKKQNLFKIFKMYKNMKSLKYCL